tara:strand:+ start:11059 stop:11379 length:321 start_codon:yes stop_codon:yes gene_type:complete
VTFYGENEGTLDRTLDSGVFSGVNETKSPPTTTMFNATITNETFNGNTRTEHYNVVFSGGDFPAYFTESDEGDFWTASIKGLKVRTYRSETLKGLVRQIAASMDSL